MDMQISERAPVVIGARTLARVRQVRRLLDEDRGLIRSMADICRQIGVNPTTLQQEFRLVYGETIFEYLRAQRLRRGADALHQGAAVSQAARLAGYTSPANFATAMKRTFGVSPKHLRGGMASLARA